MTTAREAGQAGLLEIIVQDDASPDYDVMEMVLPPAKPERNAVNLGFAGNCNAGARRATGDVLMFLNQDTKAREAWFAPLMAAFDNPAVGIVGPKLVFDGDKIQSIGGLFDGGRGPFHRWLGWQADDWRVNVRERVSWTTGAALAIRRSLFEQIGGFDEGYRRGYFEDVDLCMRARMTGAEIWYEPSAVFEHNAGTNGGVPAEIFKANSMRFHSTWDKWIEPDTPVVHVPF